MASLEQRRVSAPLPWLFNAELQQLLLKLNALMVAVEVN